MFNHAPEDYVNPFQLLIRRERLEEIESNLEDIFYDDDDILAFVASSSEPKNQGNVLIVPKEVYENIYDMPDEILAKIAVFSKKIAIAMKNLYQCDGVSLRQHNEPAGCQDVWHYHLHIIPRYVDDDLYSNYHHKTDSVPEVRAAYAQKLREYFSHNT